MLYFKYNIKMVCCKYLFHKSESFSWVNFQSFIFWNFLSISLSLSLSLSLSHVREHFMKRFYGGLAPHNGGVFPVSPRSTESH